MTLTRFAAVPLSLLAVAAIAGCGGANNVSSTVDTAAQQAAIEKAKDEAVREALDKEREKAKTKDLQKQINKLKRQQRQRDRRSDPGGDASGAQPRPAPSLTSCGGGISVGPNTSCVFARNVVSAYYDSGGGSTAVVAYSSVTNRSYTMYCQAGAQIVCTGANNASVYF